jgi:urease subunit beta
VWFPGQYRTSKGFIELNKDRSTVQILVMNTGDRPVQVGSHFHFFEVNRALQFNREEAFGMRLNIPAGTAVRFEPGEEKPVSLVELGGVKHSYGLNDLTRGIAEHGKMPTEVMKRWKTWEGDPS